LVNVEAIVASHQIFLLLYLAASVGGERSMNVLFNNLLHLIGVPLRFTPTGE
jgi:hypothetical protein